MLYGFTTIVSHLSEDPHSIYLRNIDLVTPEDTSKIAQVNSTYVNFEKKTFRQMIQSAEFSLNTAIICEITKCKLTYSELNIYVSFMQRQIKSIPTYVPGKPICIIMLSSADAIAVHLALVFMKIPYTYIDPGKSQQARDRVLTCLEIAKCTTVLFDTFSESIVKQLNSELIQSFKVDFLSKPGFSIVSADSIFPFHLHDNVNVDPEPGSLDDTLGVYFTSGTTGKPKGAVITHGNAYNMVHNSIISTPLLKTDVIILFSSLSFIFSIRQYLPTLCAGAALVIPESTVNFIATIRNQRANRVMITPTALATFSPKDAPDIQSLIVGGEKPVKADFIKWHNAGVRMINGYGYSLSLLAFLFLSLQIYRVFKQVITIINIIIALLCRLWIH
jgi:acyl-coenzyme A synthetase/AMP-(fatty) acid ligase